MKRKIVSTRKAPAAIGPYSQAVRTGNLLFVSGQLPINPETNTIITGDIENQTEQVLANLSGILEAENLGAENVIKVTIFLKDMNDFAAVNKVYAGYFSIAPPARECVEVARLPKDAGIEISLIAACAE